MSALSFVSHPPLAILRALPSMSRGRSSMCVPPVVPDACEACEGVTSTLTASELESYRVVLPSWNFSAEKISKQFRAKNFNIALDYLNRVGEICEAEGHHADMSVFGYNKVKIDLSTHALGGVSLNDIILATKVDALSVDLSKRPF